MIPLQLLRLVKSKSVVVVTAPAPGSTLNMYSRHTHVCCTERPTSRRGFTGPVSYVVVAPSASRIPRASAIAANAGNDGWISGNGLTFFDEKPEVADLTVDRKEQVARPHRLVSEDQVGRGVHPISRGLDVHGR